MGSLFSGYLSRANNVTVVDVSDVMVNAINANGVNIKEKNGEIRVFNPHAVKSSAGIGHQDLVIVFVKSMFTISALEGNRNLIGPDTFLMTLQNGAGHEILIRPVKPEKLTSFLSSLFKRNLLLSPLPGRII